MTTIQKPPFIYADYQATTQIAPEVAAVMADYAGLDYGNPSSTHRLGREARASVELAREQIAALLPKNGALVFTSGATEALNWGLKGLLNQGQHLVISAIEHAAVLEAAAYLATTGVKVSILPVNRNGIVEISQLPEEFDMLAVMQVNNEIGTIQPISELARLAHQRGALMLCDAVQAYGRIEIAEGPDLIAISAHKIHGPKAIGALWLRDGVKPRPLLHGGGQENGLRSGSLSPALCAGFGQAAALAEASMAEDMARIKAMAARLIQELGADWELNGSATDRYAGNLNLYRAGLDVARLISEVRGVAFSAASACASGSGKPSHVLAALGYNQARIKSCLRLGIGRYNSIPEMISIAEQLNRAAESQV